MAGARTIVVSGLTSVQQSLLQDAAVGDLATDTEEKLPSLMSWQRVGAFLTSSSYHTAAQPPSGSFDQNSPASTGQPVNVMMEWSTMAQNTTQRKLEPLSSDASVAATTSRRNVARSSATTG